MTKTAAQKAASLLGQLARGKRKTLTEEQRQQQADRLAEARKKRWPERDPPEKKSAD